MNFILRSKNEAGEWTTREFWCPSGGGYVREIDAQRPGTLGRQINYSLGHMGNMMTCRNPEHLAGKIRAARRRELAEIRREGRE